MKKALLLIGLLALMASDIFSQPSKFPILKGPYLGQTLPGIKPEIFAPGIISTESHEFSCSFSPDGKEFYFNRIYPTLNEKVIMVTAVRGGVWTDPMIVPFMEYQFSF